MNGEKPKKAADLPFRPGVGAMLFNGEGEVFVGRRFGPRGSPHRGPRGAYAWQMPQGGIDDGETPAMAVMRELASARDGAVAPPGMSVDDLAGAVAPSADVAECSWCGVRTARPSGVPLPSISRLEQRCQVCGFQQP